ncbi:MAG: DUF1820 family protein [Candidatus Dasytiphilus stammeri]
MSSDRILYRIQFMNNSKNYQLYVREISNSSLFGFIEIGDFIFTTPSTVLIDPSTEKLKMEFQDVTKSYIPVQAVIRIDRVKTQGSKSLKDIGDNIATFPLCTSKKNKLF